MKITITKLLRPERCGDWHDRPLRWAVSTGRELQKFSTKAEARLYRRLRRRSVTEQVAMRAYAATA